MSEKFAAVIARMGEEYPPPFIYVDPEPENKDDADVYSLHFNPLGGIEKPKFFIWQDGIDPELVTLHAIYGDKVDHPQCTWIDDTFEGAIGKAGIPYVGNMADFSDEFLAEHLPMLLRLCNYPFVNILPPGSNPLLVSHLRKLLAVKDKLVPKPDDIDDASLEERISYLLSNPRGRVDEDYLLFEELQPFSPTLLVVPDKFFPSTLLRTSIKDRMRVLSGYLAQTINPLREYIAARVDLGDVDAVLSLTSYSEWTHDRLFYQRHRILHGIAYGLVVEEQFVYDMTGGLVNPCITLVQRDARIYQFSLEYKLGQEITTLTEKNLQDDSHGVANFNKYDYKQLVFFATFFFKNQALVDKYTRALNNAEQEQMLDE